PVGLLLPAGLDVEFDHKGRLLRSADLIEGKTRDEAVEALLADPERSAGYLEAPWLRDFDREMLAELNPVGVPRAIREVIHDWPLRDRREMAKGTAPTPIICRRGDAVHPLRARNIRA